MCVVCVVCPAGLTTKSKLQDGTSILLPPAPEKETVSTKEPARTGRGKVPAGLKGVRCDMPRRARMVIQGEALIIQGDSQKYH